MTGGRCIPAGGMLRLLLFVLLLFSVSANAQTIIDSLTVTPPTIDVSGGDQFATVTAYLRHSPGSLSIVYIFFGHPDSSTLIGFALLTSGTASDGTWEGQVYVPQSTPPGTYPVYLLAYDDVFNLETINTGKSVPITGGESEPPVLASMPVVTPSSIDVSGGPDTAIVDFDLTDNSSGVAIAYAGFERGDTLTIATGFASLVSGDILNGSWRAIVIIPQNANGQFDLRITAYDHASNYLDTNIGPALTVTGGDTILPSILGTPILDRSAVNVGGGDQDVTVTLTAMDTYSGIESINAYFSDDTGNSAGYSYLTTLVSGDSLSGTWELNTTFDSFTPEGTYHLLVGLADVSGNYTELTFTGITVVVSRAPEADVTFRLDTRRLERLGLLRRGSGTDPTVHIFEDPNTGTYSMDDGNNDSIWTITTLIQTGQTLHYAFALPASGGDVFELGGEAGGRSVPVDSQGALILPVRSFDDIPPSAVDPGYAVVLNSGFSPGDPSVYNFTVDTIRTFFSIDFASLDRNAIVAVRRYGSTPGGSLPGGIVTMAPLYWGIASAPAAAVFNGKTIFAYNFFGGVSDPSTLRLLRRTDNGQPWAVVPTLVDQDQRTLEAVGISGFSEWTIGSTNPANSLVPAIPGLVSNPNPPDSSSGVAGFPTLFWNPAQGAYNYDLYLWPAAEAMPGTPTISNLIETQYQPYPALAYGVQYNWLVVAKNITGSTQGPVWTFSTQQVADLVVTDVQVPPGAFSGQAAEITWTVTNNGATGTTAPAWQDRIYFSTDSILTTITDPVLGTAPNMSALGPGESYTNHGTFIIPNGTFGVYRIIVVSDLFDSQPESNGGNNIFIRDLTVSLTPPPDLQVDVVSVPALGFSGQTVALQYTVKNHGTNPTTSSLWDDIVYLSRDSVLVPATSWFLRTFRRTAALLPESSYTITDNIRLPDTVSGPLFVHVWTDYRNFVFEYAVEDNNMRHAPITVNLSPPPDLVVTNVSAPATGNSGSAVSVTWTVANPGSADVTRNWYDRVMIAKGAAYNPDSVTVLGTFSSVRPLQRDSSYTRQENVTLPNGISGTYYLHVEADWQRKIFESIFDSNNVTTAATPTVVALSPWPDLVVTNIAAPSAATANDIITVGWTVTDNGSGAVSSGLWTDSVYLSSSGTWDSSNAVALIGVDQNQPLAAAGSYTAQAQVRIPPGTTGGTYYVYVLTDRHNTVYEHTDEGNNTGKSGGLTLSAYPPVDLAVTSLNTDAAGSSGNAFAIGYTVTNTGGGTTLANSWLDIVYLSPDSVLDYGYDMVLNRVDRVLPLAAGAAYTRTMSPVIPNGISGDYYVIVQADSAGKVIDADPANNRRHTTTPVTITLTPSPDLSVSGVTAPSGGQAGQPLTVTWIVGNNGADMSAGRAWLDGLYLSADATVDNEDARLGSVERNGPLLNGATYIDTLEIVLPNYASGVYYLLARADSRNDIYEHNAEANNTGSRLITVTLPPPADLVVSSVVIPPAGTVGEDVTIGWTIENQGVNSATGRMTDAVYFSADNAWDLSDLLLGTILRDIDIAPGASEKKSLKANLSAAWLADSTGSVMEETPGLSPGDYYVIVRTDIRNNIRETDVTNNQGASGSTMNVDVQSLTLGVTDSGTISSASPRYYRVDVPANLDLRVTAVSSIAYPSIDLFSAYDRVPTGNSYDHRNFDPVSLNREVLVPSTQVGSYYLLMRSIINPHPLVTESYTVLAETLGFSVTSVIPGNGGSGGFVTGRMQGAGFRATSRIFLYDGAQQVAEAELREFKSTMETNIRWDLRGVPLGTYDVEVRNEDNSTARLPAGFTVEPMQDPAISIGKTLPRALLPGRRQTYHIRFTNTSNVDIQYFTAMIAVPEGTEISVVSENDLLRTRSMMVPDSLIPEGKSVDDWVESGSGRFVPLIGRDLPPGDAYVCRVTFRNTAYPAGSSFPMLVTTKTATKELFLEIQVAQIEKYRADILRQSAGVDPEYVARANDPVAFTRYALSSYVSMGLLDSADVPGVGMEAIAAATGQWGLANPVFAAAITPRFPGLFSPNTNKDCEQFFNIVACPAAIIDCFIDLPFIPPPISVGLCVFGIATSCLGFDFGPLNYIGCIGIASGLTCLGKEFLCRDIVASLDPNDIIGPDGAGDERWVARQQTLPYTIRFQNDSVKATAPARRVTITQDLDSTVDVRSLRLGSYGFGAQVYSVPENVSTYNDRLDLRDSMGIFVDVTAGIDIVNGRLAWTFNSVDPLTGGEPPDPFTGFLPVDDSTGRGSGFVSYTVRPSPESKTRDTVHAIASIVFDINDPLDTPPIFNLVDAASPVSSVRPLPPTIDITSFPVQWGGIDDSAGSGSKHYTIYYSRNGEPYTPWLTNVTDTIAVFTGIDTSQYSFFSIATDTAGNTEAFKSTPDATTTILTGVEDQVEELPKTFALLQNYPNPFNPTTLIRYDVPSAAWVRLAVYNVLGQEVTVLINGPEDPGHRVVEWNALNRHGLALGSGVYFYRMQSGAFSDMKKMMLVK